MFFPQNQQKSPEFQTLPPQAIQNIDRLRMFAAHETHQFDYIFHQRDPVQKSSTHAQRY